MNSAEIKGHENPINILLNSLKANHLANSYLFVGPQGIGKTLVAKYFAQVLNCQQNNLDACGICSSCRKIKNLNHPDVHWVEADTSGFIKIEQVRRISLEINLRPFEARFKVFIIVDAQNLTEEAGNSLLKTLEEPPQNSVIILTASQIKMVFATIVSRCQRINFYPLSQALLEDFLCKEYHMPDEASHYLSSSCEGRLGKSLRLNNPEILREKNLIIGEFLNLSKGYPKDLQYEDKQKVGQLLTILLQWFRDMMILKAGLNSSNLINIDRKNDLLKLKERYSFEEILASLRDIIEAYSLLDKNLNLKITLSLLKEKLCRS